MKHLILCFLFVATSCTPYTEDVMSSLELAGENESELIEVLEYCKKQGKLEYEAAYFLISNMKYHRKPSFDIFGRFTRIDFKRTDSLYNAICAEMSAKDIFSYT